MSLHDFIKGIRSRTIDPVENIKKVLEECKTINKTHNFFNTISEDLALNQAKTLKDNPKGKLAGIPISVKDCICVQGVESTAGSKMLKGYKPVFNATAVQRVIDQGGILIGKTSQDAFGFGSFNLNVGKDFKIPKNPLDKTRVCGGSSGGSAGITKKLAQPHLSLAESTGGSIVAPAAFCSVYGLSPTYSLVSRYGLIDYGNSLDKIGPMSTSLEGIALLLKVIAGNDPKDSTSSPTPNTEYEEALKKPITGMTIGLLKESLQEPTDPKIIAEVEKVKGILQAQGATIKEISLPITMKYALAAYYVLAMSEASTNLAKLCGMRYGQSLELKGEFHNYFANVRTEFFNKETIRRIMLGTFVRMAGYRDAYYLKAAKLRTLIIQEYKKVFGQVDAILSPTMPVIAPKVEDINNLTPVQNYMMDILTVGPNLAGLPHLNIPTKDFIGVMLTADHFKEDVLLTVASRI